jgi:hypothetical protein
MSGDNMSDTELAGVLGELKAQVKSGFESMGREIGELRTQIGSFNREGHASTQMHCKQLADLEAACKESRKEVDDLKEAQRQLTTKVAVIVTALSVGGSAVVNVVSKLL